MRKVVLIFLISATSILIACTPTPTPIPPTYTPPPTPTQESTPTMIVPDPTLSGCRLVPCVNERTLPPRTPTAYEFTKTATPVPTLAIPDAPEPESIKIIPLTGIEKP